MASTSFASESLMDPRIQVKLDKYQKCGNIISQTSLLSSFGATGSETDADSDTTIYIYKIMKKQFFNTFIPVALSLIEY